MRLLTAATLTTFAVGALAAPAAEAEPWCSKRVGVPCTKRDAIPEPVAAPAAEAEPWCSKRVGVPCTKRDAIPEPLPAPEPEPVAEPEPWCTNVGEPCTRKRDVFETHFQAARSETVEGKIKRAAYALAGAIESPEGTLKARNPSPEADLSNLPGGAAFMAKRGVNELAKVIALASEDPADVYTDYDVQGNFDADSDVNAKRSASPAPWCSTRVGVPCTKRDVAADKRWCSSDGQACSKAKRAAEAVLGVVGDLHENLARAPFDAEKREPEPWCSHRVGVPCTKKRDLMAIQSAARDLLTSLE